MAVYDFEDVKNALTESLGQIFPVTHQTRAVSRALHLEGVEVRDKDADDYPGQYRSLMRGGNWTVPVYADLTLRGPEGVIDRKKVKIMDLPKLTPRGSYIMNGKEFQLHSTLRRKSGIFGYFDQTGKLVTEFNLEEGLHPGTVAKYKTSYAGIRPKMVFNDKKKQFEVELPRKTGQKKVALYSLLNVLGYDTDGLQKRLGRDLHESNQVKPRALAGDIKKLYTSIYPKGTDTNTEDMKSRIREAFERTKVSPDTTEVTLGKRYDTVTPEVLISVATKMMDIGSGRVAPDDRESLSFQRVVFPPERLSESITHETVLPKIKKALSYRLGTKKDKVLVGKVSEVVPMGYLSRHVQKVVTSSPEGDLADYPNPVAYMSGGNLATKIGTGSAQQERNLPESASLISPSHLGFIDPLHTPEGSRAGINLHLAIGARNRKGTLITEMLTPKGEVEELSAAKASSSIVAFPESYDMRGKIPRPRGKTVRAQVRGVLEDVDPKRVDFILKNPESAYDIGTNLVPFLQNDQGNRSMTAAKQVTQAVPLINREVPWIQTGFEQKLGEEAGAALSPVDGTVTSIARRRGGYEIRIKPEGKGKEIVTVRAHRGFPLGKGTELDTEISDKVTKGAKVTKGQVLADSTFTRDGTLALGVNLRTAYMPWYGLNYDDSVVVSENAADKLTSQHLHKEEFRRPDVILNDNTKEIFTRWFHSKFDSPAHIQALDKRGVIKKGQNVEPGQILVASYRPLDQKGRDFKLRKNYGVATVDPEILVWNSDSPGRVKDVEVARDGTVRILVETKERLRVGDKIVGRHGNKGVVSRIVPNEEMPIDEDGRSIDIIQDPLGVVGRINVGQVHESVLGKVAEKQGTPIRVTQFGPQDYLDEVRKEAKRAKLNPNGTEILRDPTRSNRPFGTEGVMVGPQYFYKLEHQVSKKERARGIRGPYDRWDVPDRGGKYGAQSVDELTTYALLAHGAVENLRDAQLYKSQQNDGLWNAIVQGTPLPLPEHITPNQRLENLLTAAGVKLQKGNTISMLPMTDDAVKRIAGGRSALQSPEKMLKLYRGKLVMDKGGLFDPEKTGGLWNVDDKTGGHRWSYMELDEETPNPLFVKALSSLTGWKEDKRHPEISRILRGDQEYEGLTGVAAIRKKLEEVDLVKEEKDLLEESRVIVQSKKSPASKAEKLRPIQAKLRYVQALQKQGLRPEDIYLTKRIPVLPPRFRPVSELKTGDVVGDDMNWLYRDMGLINKTLSEAKLLQIPDNHLKPLREGIWDARKAFVQSTGSDKPLSSSAYQGIVGTIIGKRPDDFGGQEMGKAKEGLFQDQVLGRRQNFSARTTITVEPRLLMDQLGVPFKMAHTVYEPWAIRKLAQTTGLGLSAARDLYDDKGIGDIRVRRALEEVAKERPVLLKRDPVLHKYGIMAFKPTLVEGKSLQIHPLVTGGFNADFDGDQQINQVFAVISPNIHNANKAFWDLRRCNMAARFKEVVGYEDSMGDFFVCDLADFPHGELIGEKGHIQFYRVPEGVKIVALDEHTGEPVLADVGGWSKHLSRKVEIVTLGSGRQIITDDDERAVYGVDADSLLWCRRRPSEAKSQFVPVLTTVPESPPLSVLGLPNDKRLRESAEVDAALGYFLGTMIGDGWVSHSEGEPKAINFSSSYDEVEKAWEESLLSVFKDHPTVSKSFSEEGRLDGSSGSYRFTVTCAGLARYLPWVIGCGAENKHLPPFFLRMPESAKWGLLSGLWDTDGSMSWSNAKKKPQFLCSYSSTSIRLMQEIQRLLQSIDISSKITPTKTPGGKEAWILNVSTVDLYRRGGIPLVRHKIKTAHQTEFLRGPAPDRSMAYSKYRLVPLPSALAKDLRSFIPRDVHWSLYVSVSKAVDRKYISKELARRVVEIVGVQCTHPLYSLWQDLVSQDNFHFERVKSIQKTGIEEDGYDLTVPGRDVFMSTDGVVLSNTMAIYVPVHPKAVEEAKKMLPTNNLISPATGKLMFGPSHSMIYGLYKMTEVGKQTGKKFKDLQDAKAAFSKGTLHPSERIHIGQAETTLGWEEVNAVLPEKFQVMNPLAKRKSMNEDSIYEILTSVAKRDPGNFPEVVDAFKELGNRYATDMGSSFSLDDFDVIDRKTRDRIFQEADVLAARTGDIVGAYGKAIKKLDINNKKEFEKSNNRIYDMVRSGARASYVQLKQINSAPVLLFDPKNRVVPHAIKNSYGEGLSLSDYWTSLHGARKGLLAKSVETQKPGYLAKLNVRTSMDVVVTEDDCGTEDGVVMNPRDPEISGRYLAQGVQLKSGGRARNYSRNSLITPDISSSMAAHKVNGVRVRTPLRCESEHGVCRKCMGILADGPPKVGTNVGIMAAQSISEPSTQLSLRVFHTGGIVEDPKKPPEANRFQNVSHLLNLTKTIPGSAVLAPVTGTVTQLKRTSEGGMSVYLDKIKKPINIPAEKTDNLFRSIKRGRVIQKGEPLSSGVIHPMDVLELKGANAAQESLVNQLYDMFSPVKKIDKRHFETVVRNMSRYTRVVDSVGSDWNAGQVAPLADVKRFNREKKRTDRVKHLPILTGVADAPLMGEDWIARLNAGRMRQTIVEAAGQGWESRVHGTNPIPALSFLGVDTLKEHTGFGRPTQFGPITPY